MEDELEGAYPSAVTFMLTCNTRCQRSALQGRVSWDCATHHRNRPRDATGVDLADLESVSVFADHVSQYSFAHIDHDEQDERYETNARSSKSTDMQRAATYENSDAMPMQTSPLSRSCILSVGFKTLAFQNSAAGSVQVQSSKRLTHTRDVQPDYSH